MFFTLHLFISENGDSFRIPSQITCSLVQPGTTSPLNYAFTAYSVYTISTPRLQVLRSLHFNPHTVRTPTQLRSHRRNPRRPTSLHHTSAPLHQHARHAHNLYSPVQFPIISLEHSPVHPRNSFVNTKILCSPAEQHTSHAHNSWPYQSSRCRKTSSSR